MILVNFIQSMVGWEKIKPLRKKKVSWLSLTVSLTGFDTENGFIISTDSLPGLRETHPYWPPPEGGPLAKSSLAHCLSWGLSSLGLFLPGTILQGELSLSRVSFPSP